MPAFVAAMTPRRSRRPEATQAPIAPLLTPLQLQTCISRGHFGERHGLGRRPDVEQQSQPLLGQRSLAVEGLHQIGGFRDLAHQDAPDETAVADDELLVGPAFGFRELDHLVVLVGRLRDAHRREFDSHDLELGGELRAMIGGLIVTARHVIGKDLDLIPERRDEAIDPAPVLGAFAHDIDGLGRRPIACGHRPRWRARPRARPAGRVRCSAGRRPPPRR